MRDSSDMELVRDYARQNSEAAFAELVQRHVSLVYSAALRHVGIAAQADEITQAVFIILARKAGGLRTGTVIEAWLYETTRLTALGFLRAERRRQFREQEAYMQSTLQESPAVDAAWHQIAPLLDDGMMRLGGKEREAVVLRFFKDKNLQEVAAGLNISEAAAQKRVHRALEKLRKFFTKRGVDSTAAIIAGAISANSVQAAPVGLAKTVTAVAVAKGAAASTSTLTVIKGALKIMAWTKMKTAVAAGLVLILAAGTATVIVKTPKHDASAQDKRAFQQESMVRLDQARQWALAMILFAQDHRGQLADNLEQLKTQGLSAADWEIVSGGNLNKIANLSQTILIREKQARRSPDGKFLKAYALADGHSQLVSSATDDFTAIEKKFGFVINPPGN